MDANEPRLRIFAGRDLIEASHGMQRLREISRLVQLAAPAVVLPDVHFKEKNFVPSGVAVALRRAVSPLLLGPPCDAMLLATSRLEGRSISEATLDRVFDRLRRRLAMFRRSDPIASEEDVYSALLHGVSRLGRTWGFSSSDLDAMDDSGEPATGMQLDRERLRDVFPTLRPKPLPDFVPYHDFVEAGRRGLGVLDGGSHFIELAVAEQIDASARTAIEPGALVVAIHAGAGDVGLIAHRAFLPDAPTHIEVLPDTSPRGQAFLGAYRAAAGYGFANRLWILAEVRDALAQVLDRDPQVRIVSDATHDMLDEIVVSGEPAYLHRKGAVRTDAGPPFYFPTHPGGASEVLGRDGNPESLWTCSHGTGRSMGRDDAVRKFDANEIEREVSRRVRLYRFGRTDFASQAPSSYKDPVAVRELIVRHRLARPVGRLTPLATLKG